MELRRQGIINSSPHLVSLSDSGILSFDTDMKSKVKECTVHFSPVQASGTPAPDNVLPISGWTGVTVNRTEKNLWNPNDDFPLVDAYDQEGNSYTRRGVVYRLPAGTYRLSAEKIGDDVSAYLYVNILNEDNSLYQFKYFVVGSTLNTNTITLTDRQHLIVYDAQAITSGTATKFSNYNIQLELGSTATPYTPHTGTTYPVTFPAVGKNLLDVNVMWDSITTLSISGETWRRYKLTVSAGTYTVSTNVPNNIDTSQPSIYVSTLRTALSNGVFSNTPVTITVTGSSLYVFIRIASTGGYQTWDKTSFGQYYIQIESGSTATSYEPYTNALGGGYVDIVGGTLTAIWMKKKISDFTWSYSTYNSANAFRTDDSLDLLGSSSEQGVICSTFASEPMVVNYASSENKPNHTIYRLYTSVERRIFIKCTEYTNVSDFLATYGNEEIAYKLDTPITYQLTPQQLSILKGTNNVWSNANGTIDLSFWAHKEPNGGLPLEYRRVEYLESTGTQYIETDIYGDCTFTFIAKPKSKSSIGIILGKGYTQGRYVGCSTVWTLGSNISFSQASDVWVNVVSVFSGGGITATVSGETKSRTGDVTNAKYALFSDSGLNYPAKVAISKCVCVQNGVTVLNLIPCVRKSDDKPGMYDTVTDTFYTNAGTGEFVVPNS